ncbi:hypothetical protein [Mycolicibacterium aubagnense]|uniref:Uncharacterized protein n=1 Tax=Mycolicibacterium aubagnense TaxID=319707 RepID=A0ABM7I6I3_9MYCO|nr:hypothetical protein [Mycolicibacterium aubagnense]BBX82149.1 hypothetical protein MAUB_00220 [Mycolicibacterium aubagnense]
MSDNPIEQAVPDEGAASQRAQRRVVFGSTTPVNIVVTVDSPDHEFYRRPGRVADVISDYDRSGPTPSVRSVTVIATADGTTSTWRGAV